MENIRAVGSRHSVLSTDLGQVKNPPVEDGMALMVDRLLESGFSEEEVHGMAVVNSQACGRSPGAMSARRLLGHRCSLRRLRVAGRWRRGRLHRRGRHRQGDRPVLR